MFGTTFSKKCFDEADEFCECEKVKYKSVMIKYKSVRIKYYDYEKYCDVHERIMKYKSVMIKYYDY